MAAQPRPAPGHGLRQVGQEHRGHAPLLHGGAGGVQRRGGQILAARGAQTGQLLRSLMAGQALGQAAQVFNQHHPQGGGQRPQLTLGQLAGLLVGVEKMHQQGFVERAVGVGHKGPCHAIHARQTGQRGALQDRQRAVVARPQPGPYFLELALDQVEIVKKPFGRRADGVLMVRRIEEVAVGSPQRTDVALQTRVERAAAQRCRAHVVRCTQVSAMLFEPRHAKDFGPQRFEHPPRPHVEHAVHRGRNPGPSCT